MNAVSRSVVVRYGEHVAPKQGTVRAHQEVISSLGYVWLGKFGVGLARSRVDQITASEKFGHGVHILLVRSSRRSSYVTLCRVIEIRGEIPVEEREAVPRYYGAMYIDVRTWFKVVQMRPVDPEVLDRLIVTSSGQNVRATLRDSIAGFFYVHGASDWADHCIDLD